jgi:hypothetical protein
MYVVVRRYEQAPQLAETMERKRREVQDLLRSVPGFFAYFAFRTAEGVVTVTVCEDKAGTDESVRVAAGWVRENLPAGAVSAPEITEGETYIDFTK